MARRAASPNELITCEYCGEKYSVTYKHCPFCNEDGTGRWDDPNTPPEEYEYEGGGRGGRRLMGGGSGWTPGRVVGYGLAIILIVAAAVIVFSILKPLLDRAPAESQPPVDSQPPVVSNLPENTAPVESQPPVESNAPDVTTPPPSGEVTPTAFTLNREDFTFNAAGQTFQMEADFQPEGAEAPVVWSIADSAVATISESGKVTAVGRGTTTITATVEGVGEEKCIVRCTFAGSAEIPSTGDADDPDATPTTLSLNREDFTLGFEGETFRLRVSGTDSDVTWATTDPDVATVSSNGTVTAVGEGACRVTATVDGVTLRCIVRCGF